MDEGDRHEPPQLAIRDRRLVEPEGRIERALADDVAVWSELLTGPRSEGHHDRDRDDRVGDQRQVHAAAPPKVAGGSPGVAGLLREPAEAGGDLGLVRGRSTAIR